VNVGVGRGGLTLIELSSLRVAEGGGRLQSRQWIGYCRDVMCLLIKQ
jgi:hypothetical protein